MPADGTYRRLTECGRSRTRPVGCNPSVKRHDDPQSVWNQLVNKNGNGAPRAVVRAFLSLGGDRAYSSYCTSRHSSEEGTIWTVVALVGKALLRIEARGPEFWDANEEKDGQGLMAMTLKSSLTDLSSTVARIEVVDTAPDSLDGVSSWYPVWVLVTVDGESMPVPDVRDVRHAGQRERAEALMVGIREALITG